MASVFTEVLSVRPLDEPLFLLETHQRRKVWRTTFVVDGESRFTADVPDVVIHPPSVIPIPRHLLFYADPSSRTISYLPNLWRTIRYISNLLTTTVDSAHCRYQVASQIAGAVAEEARKSQGAHGFWMVAQAEVVYYDMAFHGPEDNPVDVQFSNSGASSSAMEELRMKRFFIGGDGSKELTSSDTCSVCLDEFEFEFSTKAALVPLPCSHVFHERCIFRWLENHKTCPLCRREL